MVKRNVFVGSAIAIATIILCLFIGMNIFRQPVIALIDFARWALLIGIGLFGGIISIAEFKDLPIREHSGICNLFIVGACIIGIGALGLITAALLTITAPIEFNLP